jgi:hypothetical protein
MATTRFENLLQYECIAIKALVDEAGNFDSSSEEEIMNILFHRILNPELKDYFDIEPENVLTTSNCLNSKKMQLMKTLTMKIVSNK